MSNQVVTQQQKTMVQFITSRKGELAKMLPKNVTADQFERAAKNAIMRDPNLAGADPMSLYSSLMRCSQDGLIPDGREAVITQFKGTATYMPMVDGVVKLIMDTGAVDSVTAKAVFENDQFDYYFDQDGEKLLYRPELNGDRGKFRLAFASVRLKSGTLLVEVMTLEDINKVKAVSRGSSGANSPWQKWFDRMAVKSAIHRVGNRMRSYNGVGRIMDVIERDINAEFTAQRDITPKQGGTATERLLGINTQPQQQQQEQWQEPHNAQQEPQQWQQPNIQHQQQQWQQPHIVQPQPQQHNQTHQNQSAADFFGEEINQ